MEYIREMLLRQRTALGRRKCGRAEGRSRLSSHGENVSGSACPMGDGRDGVWDRRMGDSWEQLRGRWGRQADRPHFGGGDAAAGPGPEACRMAVYGRLRTGWHRRDRRFCREAESHDGGWRSVRRRRDSNARRRSGGDVLSSAGTPGLRRGRNDGERQGAVPHGAAGRPPV